MVEESADNKRLILKHAILNAVQYDGKTKTNIVLGKILGEHPELKGDLEKTRKIIESVVDDVNSWSLEKQKETLDEFDIEIEEKTEDEYGLPELKNADNRKVVMRMAPYPSGPLHIGNARMAILNDEYVKRNDGKLILVYDDTIGSEEKNLLQNGYDLIKDGLDWLGITIHETHYKSDRMEIFYKYAEEMIKNGWAYVCMCSSEELRKGRIMGIECDHRKHNVKKNLKLWKKMMNGGFEEGDAVVRLKTDMKHKNPAFRDRVLLRICNREHPRVGDKYHVWPLLEFSWAIDDHELGMTHILRGKDLIIEDEMEEFIWDKFGWDKAEFLHYGMLKLNEMKLSKSNARVAIEQNKLDGWGDPRTWSLQSLKKRGIRPKAIRKFILRMGMSLADVSVPAKILYAENRKLIDADAKRYFAVLDPMEISLKSVDRDDLNNIATVPSHPDYPKHGNREIPIDSDKIYIEKKDYKRYKDKKIGLINLCTVDFNKDFEFISSDVDVNMSKIHWVSEPNVEVEIVMPNGERKKALMEPSIEKAKKGDILQLMRTGFCRVEHAKKDIVLYFAHK